MHPFKGIQKNMLKEWSFNKYKLCHRFFDNNLLKNCRTNTLESDTAQILFESCFNGRLMLRQSTYLNFKMIPSFLAIRKISPLEF